MNIYVNMVGEFFSVFIILHNKAINQNGRLICGGKNGPKWSLNLSSTDASKSTNHCQQITCHVSITVHLHADK